MRISDWSSDVCSSDLQQQDHPRRYTMQNCAEFHIIGRVGKVDPKEKVTHLDVAANYPRRDGEGWKDDPHWNRVTCFGKMHEKAAKIGKVDPIGRAQV